MSHKVDPRIYRIKKIDDWKTRGYYQNSSQYLEEDFRIRKFLNKKFVNAGVEKIEIERFPGKINIIVFTSRPGLVIGRGGEGVERVRKELEKELLRIPKKHFLNQEKSKEKKKKKKVFETKFSKKDEKKTKEADNRKKTEKESEESKVLRLEIREVRNLWTSAQLSADWVAQQIERRNPYRKVIKQALNKIISNKEIKGARIEVSGRLNGAEIARREWLSAGSLPRQTLRAVIDYAKKEAHCSYGTIGVKVWIYKGERLD